MYAAQKYSAEDRVAISQNFAVNYPDRVPLILSSPHWNFYSFKCMLVPQLITIRELCDVILKKWKRKFPTSVSHLLLKVASGSIPQTTDDHTSIDFDFERDPLPASSTIQMIAQYALSSDGFLYVTAHELN